ncbi:unnamed protein product [Phytophthora fragariaefolia]|uniref:Unnamed protein product n=1 Tax=Phytophthora fragariaefolia TaxID=1490495 RepID=A0A9W7D9U5_9STRA|nr:unnamed protein product [Phytophthora fragariaefolia]
MGASDESRTAQTPAERMAAKHKAKGVAQKAVIWNISKALEGHPGKRLIIADNFNTSCALSIALLEKGHRDKLVQQQELRGSSLRDVPSTGAHPGRAGEEIQAQAASAPLQGLLSDGPAKSQRIRESVLLPCLQRAA